MYLHSNTCFVTMAARSDSCCQRPGPKLAEGFFFPSVTSSARCCFARSSPHNCITHPSGLHSSGSVLGAAPGHAAPLTAGFALPERGAAAAGVSLGGFGRRWLPRAVSEGAAHTQLPVGLWLAQTCCEHTTQETKAEDCHGQKRIVLTGPICCLQESFGVPTDP